MQEENKDVHDDVSSPGTLFVIQKNAEYGRFVVAGRHISKKTRILEEVPVMVAPWPIDDKVTFHEPLCLGCCTHMRSVNEREESRFTEDSNEEKLLKEVNRCTKCGWPVCSAICQEIAHHKDNECQLFQETKLPYPPPGDEMNIVTTSVMIQLIRCLLIKRNDYLLWNESVLGLQHETALATQPWNFHLFLDDIKQIFPTLESKLGDRTECCRILSVININAFSNTFSQNAEFSGCAICLFLEASMIAHSCTPNCWWTLTEDPSHKIIIKSSEMINQGDLITVCYSNQYSVFGTWKRQEMFRNVGGFTCKCKRCIDPFELGSLVSAVVCENCMLGFKLPIRPTVAESKWKCARCGHVESAETVESLVKALESRLSSCVGKVPLLVRFLENCKSLVHNNHWVVTQTEDEIMREWARDPELRYRGIRPQDILMTCEYFISLCFHVLQVRNITSPGLSFHRIRYVLFYARARMARLELLVSIMEERRHPGGRSAGWGENYNLDLEIQSLRQEYQEIMELYHEVIEYRQMSEANDAEVKNEIQHMMKLMKPIVQMEPHQMVVIRGGESRSDGGGPGTGPNPGLEEGDNPAVANNGCTLT